MRAIVIGAGKVGFHVARQLSSESCDVVVIDISQEALEPSHELLDVMTINGNGAAPGVLEQAGVRNADLVVAVTEQDEVNIVACLMAKNLGSPTTVARVRNPEYTEKSRALTHNQMGIDLIINPELLAATSIVRLLRMPSAVEVGYFAGGRVQMIGLRPTSPHILGKSLQELELGNSLIVALARDDEIIIPHGDSRIEEGDLVYVIGQTGNFEKSILLADRIPAHLNTVTIVGGGETGYEVARALGGNRAHGLSLKVIEKRPSRARWLAERLPHVLIVRGDGSGFDLLESEHIRGSDALVAVTGQDETNMLMAMVAKRLDVQETIIRLDREEYAGIAEAIGVHATVVPRLLTASTILKLLRKGKVRDIAFVQQGRAEVIDAFVPEGAPITGEPLATLRFPTNAIIAMVVRDDRPIIPHGKSQIKAGDRVVIFSVLESVAEVEKALGL